jgi:hypothetical protein
MQSKSLARQHARSPGRDAPFTLVTDASTTAIGIVLQQWTKYSWQLLNFSKKMSTAQQKYSA